MYKYSRTPCFAGRKPVPKDAHAYYFHLIIKNVRITHTYTSYIYIQYIIYRYKLYRVVYSIQYTCRKHRLQ